nr:MAG TPA: hypothetical protein [Caudoviricetes sp.]
MKSNRRDFERKASSLQTKVVSICDIFVILVSRDCKYELL